MLVFQNPDGTLMLGYAKKTVYHYRHYPQKLAYVTNIHIITNKPHETVRDDWKEKYELGEIDSVTYTTLRYAHHLKKAFGIMPQHENIIGSTLFLYDA